MSKKRKYFRYSAQELKEESNKNKDDIDILEEILEELGYRKTPAAKELKSKIENYIGKKPEKVLVPKKEAAKPSKPAKPKVSNESVGLDEPQATNYLKKFSLVESKDKAKSSTQKYLIKLRNDELYKLGLSDDASTLDRQITALDKYVLELRNTGKNNTYATLTNGYRLEESLENYLYSFELDDPLDLFEGARVEITIANQEVEAKVASVLDAAVVLEFESNLGKKIDSCSVKIDRTSLLRALYEKLGNVRDGDFAGFNHELVEKVLRNSADQLEPELEKNVLSLGELNDEQSLAIRNALANEVTYIWGPPGTGKTKTLGVLIENFFDRDERTLIASNTNQAVDQVLLKLCQQLGKDHKAVKEGYILRRGKIDLKELDEEWREFIDLDSVVEKKSKTLKEQEQKLEAAITKLSNEAEGYERILKAFKALDEKQKLLEKSESKLEQLKGKLKSNKSDLKNAKQNLKDLQLEEEKRENAGFIAGFLQRSKQQIQIDLRSTSSLIVRLEKEKKDLPGDIEKNTKANESLKDDVKLLEKNVKSKDKTKTENSLEKISEKRGPLEADLATVRAEIEGIKEKVLAEAKIVGATVTKTYLQQDEYVGFNNVVIDEASMVILPSLYNIIGFADKRCIISGDFRQIAPIVESRQEEIFNEISRDIFSFSGIEAICHKGRNADNLVMLTKQYRMQSNICNLINSFMYRGKLKTAKTSKPQNIVPDFRDNIVIIDTSKIFPFSQKKGTSYYNLMHALAVRNLINIFNEGSGDKKSIGVCAPYAAQSKMHASINSSQENVVAGTVHRFQGDEKNIMIIDTVDSLGEGDVGFWALSDLPSEDGCRLWNVAISRAQDHLYFIGNLTHLNTHLPKDSFLRTILYNAQNSGQVIDVDDILRLNPETDDLKHLTKQFELDDATLEKGLFNNRDFERVFLEDIKKAEKTIAIYSGFITPSRVAHYGDTFRAKISEGVKIRCITRPPRLNGNMREELGKEALDALENIGCVVDTRANIHQKAAIIDDEISWFGSLNPLSHTSTTEETMARIDNKTFASQLIQNLALKFIRDTNGASVIKENPACNSCNGRSSFHTGTYGRPDYWRCEVCSKTESVVNRGKKIKDRSHIGEPCPFDDCDGVLELKSGRYGEYWRCTENTAHKPKF